MDQDGITCGRMIAQNIEDLQMPIGRLKIMHAMDSDETTTQVTPWTMINDLGTAEVLTTALGL